MGVDDPTAVNGYTFEKFQKKYPKVCATTNGMKLLIGILGLWLLSLAYSSRLCVKRDIFCMVLSTKCQMDALNSKLSNNTDLQWKQTNPYNCDNIKNIGQQQICKSKCPFHATCPTKESILCWTNKYNICSQAKNKCLLRKWICNQEVKAGIHTVPQSKCKNAGIYHPGQKGKCA